MGLAGLDAALSGLRIAQNQISIISNNVANAGTPGYTRKILPQVSQAVNGVTVGVLGETIVRQVDLNLERDLWTQVSAVSSLNVQATYLNQIQQFHGAPDAETSISAQLGKLQDSFSTLADSPEDSAAQGDVVNKAVDTAQKLNDLSNLISKLRNDAQDDMSTTISRINDLLTQIATVNADVEASTRSGRTSAASQDLRDNAIKELSGLINISFFKRADGVLVVQTPQGSELASDVATPLTFRPGRLSPLVYYPGSSAAAGVYVGDPLKNPAAFNITSQDIGGKLGGLLQLRDQILPQETAQTDELAYRLASRFNQQGLELFTDHSGNLPQDTAPNPNTLPSPTPVPYVGFAGQIQVNQDILADHTLLQKGTYGAVIPSGSNEVIRRVIQNSFGDVAFQQAIGDIDLRVSGNAPPNDTLQNFLGIHSTNKIDGTRDLSSFPDPATFITAANGSLAPGSDTFRLTFRDTNLGLGPVNVDIALGAVPNTGGDFTQDLISYINTTVIPALGAPAQADLTSMGVSFAEGSNGQLQINSNAQIATDGTVVPNGMGAAGLALLGLGQGTFQATDPYFDIQVGNNASTRITIDSDDTEVDLMAKLNAVRGLGVQDITTSPDGFLRLRPGDSYTNPDFGGDMKIIAGPFQTNAAGANTVVGPGTIPNGVNIASALFGSFSTGPLQDIAPVSDVSYQSQTNASLAPPIPTTSIRDSLLGPGANISTGITGSSNIIDFAQRVVSQQSQVVSNLQSRQTDEQSLQDVLQKQLDDNSGVNIDEELGNLIVVQNAYAASARVIGAVSDLFQELLNAI